MRLSRPAALLILPLLLTALPAGAQDTAPPAPGGEFGCDIGPASPCRGRVDFERGGTYEFKIAGPGTALIQNEGNRRCTLSYSATDSRSARSSESLNLTPGQVAELPVADAQGLILRFTDRGTGSRGCDLLFAVRP